MRLPIAPDSRSPGERDEALVAARDGAEARALLSEAVSALSRPLADAEACARDRTPPPDHVWTDLDRAYEALDRYLLHLLRASTVRPSCGPSCSACCVDAPPVLAVEGLRMARAMKKRSDGVRRIKLAIEQARAFQSMLVTRTKSQSVDTSSSDYRETQLAWRSLGRPCPFLGDDGNCGAYDQRPVACRVHFAVEDPSHCETKSPRFLLAERPRVWGHPREHEFEVALRRIGQLLELEEVPNLQWGVARFHDHPLARSSP